MDYVKLHAGHRGRLSPGASDIIDSCSRFGDGQGLTTEELIKAARLHTGRDVSTEGLNERDMRERAAEELSDLSVTEVYAQANR